METLNSQENCNSFGLLSRKREAVISLGENVNERKRLRMLDQDHEYLSNQNSDNITNCKREHMVCEPCYTTETSFIETNFNRQMCALDTMTDDREQMTETINVDNYPIQNFTVSQPATLVPFMDDFNNITQKALAPSQTSSGCPHCRAGQPGHIHHIRSF